MAKYFHISRGLRGCYMPDAAFVLKTDTRRDLKAAIADEAAQYRNADYAGGSKKDIAKLAAWAWRDAHKAKPAALPACLPFRPSHSRSYSEGVFVSVATRAEYLEHLKHEGE